MSKFSQKGVSLYIALVILAVILAVVLGLNTILLGQIKMIRGMGYSVIAYYTAETGAERGIFKMNTCGLCVEDSYAESLNLDGDGVSGLTQPTTCSADSLKDPDDSCYQFRKINPNPNDPEWINCGASTYCFKIMGYYKGTRRAIEVKQ